MPPHDRIRKVEALVISHRDFGEADRTVKLFTREEGKLTAIAKGARRIRSRKAAHLEPFTHAALVLAVGRNFWIVTQADTLSDFPAIRADLQKTGQASYVLELVDQISADFQADSSMYRLLLETLRRLEKSTDAFNLILYYELRVLDRAGFRPEIFKCVGCGKEIQAEDQFFSATQGGVLCPRCGAASIEKTIPAGIESLRYLRHFQRSAYRKIADVEISGKTRAALRRVLDFYIASVTDRRLNSPGFLNQINHIRPASRGKTDIE